MSRPRDDRQDDLFRSSLEAIINLRHPLVRLAAEINWDFLAKRFVSVCRVGPGQPPLPTHAKALHGNPYDGHTLGPVIADLEKLTAGSPKPSAARCVAAPPSSP
jgi:hypothetical protein